jgi:hypothetical protein
MATEGSPWSTHLQRGKFQEPAPEANDHQAVQGRIHRQADREQSLAGLQIQALAELCLSQCSHSLLAAKQRQQAVALRCLASLPAFDDAMCVVWCACIGLKASAVVFKPGRQLGRYRRIVLRSLSLKSHIWRTIADAKLPENRGRKLVPTVARQWAKGLTCVLRTRKLNTHGLRAIPDAQFPKDDRELVAHRRCTSAAHQCNFGGGASG